MQLIKFARPLFVPRYAFSKDYYRLLGVPHKATPAQIQEAYSKKAAGYRYMFVPDVSTTNTALSQEKGREFQDIAEAYAVLSVQASRNFYDLMNREQGNLVYGEERAKLQSVVRGEDGHVKTPGVVAGSYAEERKNWLVEERKRFNVDEFGRYRGGLPQPERGVCRGKGLLGPGYYHEPLVHNSKIDPLNNEHRITGQVAQEFKVWQNEQKAGKQWQYLYQVAEIDYDFFKFKGVRIIWAWVRNLFLVLVAFPWLVVSYCKRNNRSVVDQIQALTRAGQSSDNKMVNGMKIVLTPTGTLKLVDPRQTAHH